MVRVVFAVSDWPRPAGEATFTIPFSSLTLQRPTGSVDLIDAVVTADSDDLQLEIPLTSVSADDTYTMAVSGTLDFVGRASDDLNLGTGAAELGACTLRRRR